MSHAAYTFFFSIYPYICLTIFLLGSLVRFDRDQYTWRSDSSQLLRAGQLRWGSNLFHIGILFLLFGHTAGLLTPHALYESMISAQHKQLVAIISGGTAGTLCFIGLTLLLHRRLSDPRIRLTSRRTDIAILAILWVQLVLGLVTLPFSFADRETASTMLVLANWAQGVVTLHPDAASLVAVEWPFKIHLVLGMTIFLLFPFTRLVHIWSGFGAVSYAFRPYQLVRSRRLNLPNGHNDPRGRA
ncbi:respiratory nitrate reductase subunit gamma [Trinickia caryophylli]|uniref:nitrate reductase (quinone) n=1 Tax=Trinickia caryophylli TaxID=28094 RepID=A0A1X7EM25_TRICW|nr:respiratory nitrate reductase subunit gamma [Trinickia caryophylli]PMS08859.1 respiratory nitrate reductase subunit gamma [Trinickia caryophylli]TRX18797.1 respiratory nitrate reductase subunit gamma [Trinickia caryophylli]WQE10405.1 respiratory nitrate reductase subunit gamma [Trinickia caryophylli]SMF35898.1 respiratory nitrate reductase gamma subunit [Trinickia caryophylli]GLU32751.1 respiratory nitrate reductase subunit [Trinickia caryophylli]